ncbi:MAG: ATP-binding protein [Proteobacteria bacterium]|nr:ATP-binding protein [Pseudomonadota bacterium]
MKFFRNLSFKDKLIILMMTLLSLSSISLFIISQNAQKRFLSEVTDSVDELSKAIQVSVQKLTSEDEIAQEKLKELIANFKKRGINEISILSENQEIIASSNPKKVGLKLGKKDTDFLIKAELGVKSNPDNIKEINIPIIIGDENYGYINVIMHLENLTALQQKNFLLRLLSTISIYILGTIIIIFMAKRFTAPIKKVVTATQKVAKDEFVTLEYDINDSPEIRELIKNFNDMVDKLKQKKELEKRIHTIENNYKTAQFSSAIAHEIKNPLNFINLAITEISEEIKSDSQDKDTLLDLLDGIKDEINKLNNLVTNFLEYDKPLKLKIELIDIISVIKDVIDFTKVKIKDLDINVSITSNKTKINMLGDKEKLSCCFLNLLLNSIESIKNEGNIKIDVSEEKEKIIISFKDDGEGIDENLKEKIFEPYFSSKANGMGLGLAFTKKIIFEHNGNIYLNTNYKEGAEFIITFDKDIKDA